MSKDHVTEEVLSPLVKQALASTPAHKKLRAVQIYPRQQTGPFYCKLYERGMPPYISTIEAVAAAMNQLIGYPELTPTVKAVKPRPQGHPYTLSQAVEYQDANQFPDSTLDHLAITRQREIAALTTYSLLMACDPDKHMYNWGKNERTNLLMHIDHDCAFGVLIEKIYPERRLPIGSSSARLILEYPNLILSLEEMFEIFDEETLHAFPNDEDTRPYNHPLKQYADKANYQGFSRLHEDLDFIQWKYFYLTKALLLQDEALVKRVIADHSVDESDDHQLDHLLFQTMMERHSLVRLALMYDERYLHFLTNNMPNLMATLEAEIEESNEHYDSDHPPLDFDTCKVKLKVLTTGVKANIATLTPEKKALRALLMTNVRINRALKIIHRIDEIIQSLDDHTNQLDAFIESHQKQLQNCWNTDQFSTLFNQLKLRGLPTHLINQYLERHANTTIEKAIKIIKEEINHAIKTFLARQESSRQYINKRLRLFICDHAQHYPMKNLPELLETLKALAPNDAVNHLCALLNRIPFPDWPNSFLLLFVAPPPGWRIELDKHYDQNTQSNFSKGYLFICALNTVNTDTARASLFKPHQQTAQSKLWHLITHKNQPSTTHLFTTDEISHIYNMTKTLPPTWFDLESLERAVTTAKEAGKVEISPFCDAEKFSFQIPQTCNPAPSV